MYGRGKSSGGIERDDHVDERRLGGPRRGLDPVGAHADVDHDFWRFCLPSLLRLLPPPRRQTVEVGSGEGRVCRELRALGHRVVGVEPSPTLARASRVADPTIDISRHR
jgi:hypothetical protein